MSIQAGWAWLDQQSLWLLAIGLMLVSVWNALQWRRDRALARQLRAQRAPLPELQSKPPLSVLVAAWNEAAGIAAHIESFQQLSYADKELLLCAGGDDGTYGIALQHAGSDIVVLRQRPGEGKQAALRRCWAHAHGQLLFLTDADCLLDDVSLTWTLAPLVNDGEDVATGWSQPWPEQRASALVLHQWCTDLYVAARQPKYVTGLLGRNAALTRAALTSVNAFAEEVRTGTDYYLAKQLQQRGYRIRHVRDSAIVTRYPETISAFWRRQSRWVRNLLLHGPRFGERDEVRAALRTCAAGAMMLLLPWAGLWLGPVVLALWTALWAHAVLARVRYAQFARVSRGVGIGCRHVMLAPWHALLDFVAWTLPALDMLWRREEW